MWDAVDCPRATLPPLLEPLHTPAHRVSTAFFLPFCVITWLNTYLVCGDVVEPLDRLHDSRTLEQHMRTHDIIVGESEGVAKTQVHMALRRQMENGVDLVHFQTLEHVGFFGNITVKEAKIRSSLEHARVVQRTAVVQLIEADDIVEVGVLGD